MWPFKRGVECGDPKSLKFLAVRITGQIPELGCHGEETVQTAVAGVAAARALGWESVMHYLDLWDHKHPAEAALTAQDCKPPWIPEWVGGGGAASPPASPGDVRG